MFEYQEIFSLMEQLADRLPYKRLKIEIELNHQSLVLEKSKQKKFGYWVPSSKWR